MSHLDALSAEIDSLMIGMGSTTATNDFSLNELDALINDMSSKGGTQPAPAPVSTGPGPVSTGPGAVTSFGPGPGRVSMGPGAASFGPGAVSTGPGAGVASFGPGRVSTGPGHVSTGPGAASFGPGPVSTGPGMIAKPPPAGRGGTNVGGVASHTPDGRAITVNSVTCAYCNEAIVGKVINALNKTYHPEHFVCTNCSQPFPGGKFVEHEGKPYCEEHYAELFAARCYNCEQPIKDNIIRALGRTYHPNHFTCQGCGINLAGKAFKEAGGDPYCAECKKNIQIVVDPTIHMCARCKKPIIGEYILLFGQRMHPEHFQCAMCGKDLRNGDCHEHQGKSYCYEDWLKLQVNVCAGCRKPIVGRSITAMGRVWHPEHFCCTHCHAPFAGSQFFEKHGLPYCEEHFQQLFGRPCAKCNMPVTSNGVETLGKIWHKDHFVCQTCDTLLEVGGKICAWEGKPLCKKCYIRLPGPIRKEIEKKQRMEAKAEKARQKEAMREAKKAEKEKASSLGKSG
jgi:hypothetical protein